MGRIGNESAFDVSGSGLQRAELVVTDEGNAERGTMPSAETGRFVAEQSEAGDEIFQKYPEYVGVLEQSEWDVVRKLDLAIGEVHVKEVIEQSVFGEGVTQSDVQLQATRRWLESEGSRQLEAYPQLEQMASRVYDNLPPQYRRGVFEIRYEDTDGPSGSMVGYDPKTRVVTFYKSAQQLGEHNSDSGTGMAMKDLEWQLCHAIGHGNDFQSSMYVDRPARLNLAWQMVEHMAPVSQTEHAVSADVVSKEPDRKAASELEESTWRQTIEKWGSMQADYFVGKPQSQNDRTLVESVIAKSDPDYIAFKSRAVHA